MNAKHTTKDLITQSLTLQHSKGFVRDAKHTPDYAPYEIHSRTDCWTLETINGKVVCSLDKDQGLNARYIVHCVNMHDELVEALEKCQHYILTRKQFKIKDGDDFSIASLMTTTLSKAKE